MVIWRQTEMEPLVGTDLPRSRSVQSGAPRVVRCHLTAVLDVRRATAEHVAKLLHEYRERLGTRKGTRALGVFKQGVLVLRWFVDGTRLAQLARDNQISVPAAHRYLHEGLTVLADHAPDLSTSLELAAAAGYTHLNLDGTVIRTDRVAARGPNGADLWWSGKHKHHGGNVQVISAPDGWPMWVSDVEPGSTPGHHRRPHSRSARLVQGRRPRPADPGRQGLHRRRHRHPRAGPPSRRPARPSTSTLEPRTP